MESVEKARPKAEQDPYRPKYHFLPPAQWMNDPNGTIFYKGEFHIFYQHNPNGTSWGHMHWGHAKSKDLVHWEHLPIALAPSKEKGEKHCFSGCCVINGDTPTIIYTKIGRILQAIRGAEQWMATSDDDMLTWKKFPGNPILTDKLHQDRKIYQWRDPYVWKEDDTWYMVLVGQHGLRERIGRAFLYRSKNLTEWEFLHELCKGTKAQGKGWECPNFFPLGNKWVLMVSPYKPVIYSIGTYENTEFKPGPWHVLDHGKVFYATNTLVDAHGRLILFGWIRRGGKEGWNGCLNLPRELSLDEQGNLIMDAIPELKVLRNSYEHFENVSISDEPTSSVSTLTGDIVEISAEFSLEDSQELGFKLSDAKKEYKISYNPMKNQITAVKQKGQLQSVEKSQPLSLHIFIDKSVIEVFINKRESITARFYPVSKNKQELRIIPFAHGTGLIKNLHFWRLNSINL